MTWTQQQYIDAVKDALDAAGNSRFSALAINNAVTIAHRTEWRHILKAAPAYRLQVLTVATNASGQIPLTSLSTGDDVNGRKRFFQVLGKRLYVGNVPYEWANPVEHAYAIGQPTNYGTSFMWWRADQVLQLLPVQAGLNVIVPVNHFPSAFGNLASNFAIEFPEDYEPIVVNSAAALLFAKGDAEVQGTADFARIAAAMREFLLSEVSHISADSPNVRAGDSPSEWGG